MSKSIFSEYAAKYYHVSYRTKSGELLEGDFQFKAEVTRREAFQADSIRRNVIGPIPQGQDVPPMLQAEAYMIGQLAIHITDAPEWWLKSEDGLQFSDDGVVVSVFDKLTEMQQEIKEKLGEKAGSLAANAKAKAEQA